MRSHTVRNAFRVASVAFALPAIASAQTAHDPLHIDTVVVTATKLPSPVSATGAAVTVITGEQLRERGLRRVIDALRTVPGVAVAQLGGTGAVASVFMRGGESDYVQVVVDGVQVNDPGGSYDWAHLTTDDIERIEIVRGPVSVLYGSNAVAGVVQIFTRGGSSRTALGVQALGGHGLRVGPTASGSYGASDLNASLATGTRIGSGASLNIGVTGSRLASDGGYAFNNGYDNRTIGAKAELNADSRAHAGFTLRSVDQTFHYPTSGSGALVDHNQMTNGNSLALGLNGGFYIAPRIETVAQLTSYRSKTGGENPADNPGDGFANSTANVRRTAAEVRMNAYLPHTSVFSAGAEADRERGESTFDSDGPFGPYSSASANVRTNQAVFAQVLAAPASRLTVTGGARVDNNDQFGNFTTGRASLSFHATDAVSLRAATGTGFKAPTFFETYATGFATGNPDLKPEHSTSIEAGIDFAHALTRVGATFFDQRFRDLIQYTFATPTPTSPNYSNVGRASARGIELTASASPYRDVGVEAEYTYVDSNVSDAGFGEDKAFEKDARLLRRPTHNASATLWMRPAHTIDGTVSVLYAGNRDDLDFTDPVNFAGARVVVPAHTTVDASATWHVMVHRDDASVLLRVTNLLDARYQEVFNFPAPRRLLWIGGSMTFSLR